MKLNDFETMVNNVIGEIDCSNYAKSFRDMGFNLHFTTNLREAPGKGNDVSKLIDEAWEAKNKRYKKKEEALKPKKETNDVSDPDWNVIAKELDNRLYKAIDDIPNKFNQEDKHD